MKLEFSRHIFEKSSNIKFHENPSSGSRVVPCGRAYGRTDMTKISVAFRNFAKTPKTQFTPNRKYHYQTFPLSIPTGNNRCLSAKCRIPNIKQVVYTITNMFYGTATFKTSSRIKVLGLGSLFFRSVHV